jgi:hypothetical protein
LETNVKNTKEKNNKNTKENTKKKHKRKNNKITKTFIVQIDILKIPFVVNHPI